MRKLKKVIMLLLCAGVCLSAVSCGNEKTKDQGEKTEKTSEKKSDTKDSDKEINEENIAIVSSESTVLFDDVLDKLNSDDKKLNYTSVDSVEAVISTIQKKEAACGFFAIASKDKEDIQTSSGIKIDCIKELHKDMGIYPGTKSTLDDNSRGDTIAIPKDAKKMSLALRFLEKMEYIVIREDISGNVRLDDLEDNPGRMDFVIYDNIEDAKKKCAYVIADGIDAAIAGYSADDDCLLYDDSNDKEESTVSLFSVKLDENEFTDKIIDTIKAEDMAKIAEYYLGIAK